MAKRVQRATNQQLNVMLDFFQSTKGLAEGRFAAINGKIEACKKWAELENISNSVLGGAQKTVVQWQVVWRDLKSRVSIKSRERRKELCQTGNREVMQAPLSELEKRVIAITGADYSEGSKDCYDSVPEGEELQIALENGDISVLIESPKNPSITAIQNNTPAKRQNRALEQPSFSRLKRKRQNKTDVFEQIAKQQADALTLQAEASKQHADALLVQAQAFNRFVVAFEEFVKQRPNNNLC